MIFFVKFLDGTLKRILRWIVGDILPAFPWANPRKNYEIFLCGRETQKEVLYELKEFSEKRYKRKYLGWFLNFQSVLYKSFWKYQEEISEEIREISREIAAGILKKIFGWIHGTSWLKLLKSFSAASAGINFQTNLIDILGRNFWDFLQKIFENLMKEYSDEFLIRTVKAIPINQGNEAKCCCELEREKWQ